MDERRRSRATPALAWAASAIVGSVLASCTLFASLGDLTSGLSAVADGSADALTSLEAGADGPPEGFCAAAAAPHAFCADFDESTVPGAGWTDTLGPTGFLDGGTPRFFVDTSSAVSAPASLWISTPAQPSAGSAIAWHVDEDTGISPSTDLDLEFDERVDAFDDGSIDTLDISFSFSSYAFVWRLENGVAHVSENYALADGGATSRRTVLDASSPSGQWFHVSILLHRGASPHWDVLLNGKAAVAEQPMASDQLLGGKVIGAAQIKLGIMHAVTPLLPLSIRFDNVTLDLR